MMRLNNLCTRTAALNSTAMSAAQSSVSTAWYAASGNNGSLQLVAAVDGPATVPQGSSPKNLAWIAGPIIGESA